MSGSFDPWRVSTEGCELILRSAFPHLTIESVVLLGEGWDSVAFLINRSLVFRLPKRPIVARMLKRERGLLLAIADRLPLPVPRYLHIADEIPGVPFGVGGYRLIPGYPLSELTGRHRIGDAVAGSLSRFLQALHRIDLEQSIPAIVAPVTSDDWWSEHWRLIQETRQTLRERLSPRTSSHFERTWELAFSNARQIGFQPALVHRDLAADHLIMDQHGKLAGIIDFGDAGPGDPAIDFAGLPEDLAQRVLSAYTEDERERNRLSIRRRFYQLAVPLHAIRSGLELSRADLVEEGLLAVQESSSR